MAYKVIKGKNKIRGEQTFVDNITGSIISASAYYGTTFTGETVSGSTGLFTNLTSSVISASAIYATTYLNLSSSINTGSLLLTASVTNATTTFTKGDGSTFDITVNNVVNAQTASILTGFNQNDYVLTSSFNNFTASYNTGSFSGSFNGTASFATNAGTASFYNTSSLLITSSISNAAITFTKGDNSSYVLTVNNVVNAQTASYVETAQTASFYNTSSLLITSSIVNDTITFTKGNGSTYSLTVNNVSTSSYASNAELLDGRDSTTFAGLTSNTFVGNQTITGNVDITGIVTANELHITYTTSSVIYTSGSTKFGDSLDDTHQFTGSIFAGIVSGTNATFNTFTGSLFGTASFATNAQTASYYDTSSLLITASVSNATVTFTKGNNTTFPITINNVVNAETASYVLNAVSSSYASNADLFDNRDSTTFAGTGSNTFNGSQTINGNLFMSGNFRLVYNNDPTTNMLFGQFDGGTIHGPYYQVFGNQYSNISQRGQAEIVYDTRNGGDSGFNVASFNGSTWTVRTRTTDNGLQVTGSLGVTNGITGSLFGTASYASLAATASYYDTGSLLITASVSNATLTFTKGDGTTFPVTINNVTNAQTASYVLNAVSASYASNADLLDGRDSTTFAGTGSNTFNGNQIITGSITATSTVSGATGLFTTITSSQSLVSNIMSVGNYVQLLPVAAAVLPTDQTASYIYTSGSTNDMYFTQYQPGTNFTNTTRLRWIEGGLSTGLLHGGVLSTVNGTNTFNLTSGSGIIVTFNASTGSDPYPTVKYVTWNNFVSQSLIYSASSPITYIAVDEFGAISQTNTAFTVQQFKDRIVIGRVLHQTGSVTNGTTATTTTAYGINSNTQDFFRAFGPLKVSGHVLAASGSTLGITRTAGDSYVEGRNYTVNPNIPNYISSVDDPAQTTTKIFYQWVSGSTVNVDTNGGVGYSALRPAFYNNNGTVTAISPTNNKFTVQRVYWFPKSVTRAFYVYYGSTIYTTLSDAISAINDEPNFVEGDNTRGAAVYIGAIALEAGTSDLTVTTKARVVNGGLFRGSGAGAVGGGGGGTTSPGGSTHEIQYNDSGVFNGSPNLTFDTTTLTLNGNFTMTGTGSINIDGGYITGSLAQFTTISGSTVTGSTALFTQITGNLFGTASHATTVTNGVYTNTSNTFTGTNTFNTHYITGSITGSDAKFTSVTGSFNGSGANLNSIPNAALNNSSVTVGSTSISLGGTATTIQGITVLTGSTITGSIALFTQITGNLFGTASYATTVTNGAFTNTNNTFTGVNTFNTYYITGSITGSDAKFTSVSGSFNGSGAGLTSIPNGALTNSSVTVGTTSISLGSSATTIQGITVLTGSTITGSTALFTQITGNLFGTASYASTAGAVANGVYTNANNTFTGINTFNTNYITGSITGSDAKFTSITGSHAGSGAGLTSIPNAALVNSSVTIGTTAISLGSSTATIQGISVLTGSTVTGSTALFTNTTSTTSIIGTALYASNTTTTVVGNNVIYNVATASYDGMFIDYTARSGSNARAGHIFAIWSGSSVNYTETTTNDFGTTTGLAMAVVINGTNMQLSASASTANWTVKTIVRTI